MNILITGGNGYIAKSLYNTLQTKYSVTSVTRNDFDLTDNIAVSKWFKNKYFDVVIHTAVIGGSRLKPDDINTLDYNLKMYYNLVSNQSHFNKLIHFGSGAELESQFTSYGLSKYVIQQSIKGKNNFYNIRIFGVFDENELDTRFIKSNIIRYIKKQPLEIYQNKFMDFIYMKDLISLVDYYILNNNLPKEVDCSYQIVYSLYEIINMINSLGLYEVDIILHNEELDNKYYGDGILSDVIECVGLEQGIKEVYNKLKNEY